MIPLYLSWETTAASALFMLVSWQSALTARTIFAPGASPWDIVTSSVVSSAQPVAPQSTAFGALVRSPIVFTGQLSLADPVHVGPQRILTIVADRRKVVSNRFRSL